MLHENMGNLTPTARSGNANQTEASTSITPRESNSGAALRRVLVVDDERDICMLSKLAFENEDCVCDTAESGEEALKLCAQNDYGIIFMDAHMDGMDGCQTTEHIRHSQRNATTPILSATQQRPLSAAQAKAN